MKCTSFVLLGIGALGLTGCPNPNTYGTPRTIQKGEIQHTLALEGINLSSTAANVNSSVTSPMLPSYQSRYGLADTMDFGLRLTNGSMLGGDFKLMLVKGDLDIAIDPGFQFAYYSSSAGNTTTGTTTASVALAYLHAPVMIGYNVSDTFTVFATPGFTYLAASGSATTDSDSTVQTSGGGALRFGLGAQVRTSRRFAITPEITGMRFLNNAEALAVIFGIGLNFGGQAQYGGGAAAPAAQ